MVGGWTHLAEWGNVLMMIMDLALIDLAYGAQEMALDPPLGFRVEARM